MSRLHGNCGKFQFLGTVDSVISLPLPVVEWILRWFPVLFGAYLGAVFASFYCVVFERVPKGLVLTGRSMCICGRQLKARENLPIIGWLASRGRARCCGARIPTHYLIAEIAGAGAVALAAQRYGGAGMLTSIAAIGVITYLAALQRRAASCRAAAGESTTTPPLKEGFDAE